MRKRFSLNFFPWDRLSWLRKHFQLNAGQTRKKKRAKERGDVAAVRYCHEGCKLRHRDENTLQRALTGKKMIRLLLHYVNIILQYNLNLMNTLVGITYLTTRHSISGRKRARQRAKKQRPIINSNGKTASRKRDHNISSYNPTIRLHLYFRCRGKLRQRATVIRD